MLTYLKDEEEYKSIMGVEDIPSNFNKLNIEASSYINQQTFGRIDENKIHEKVKYATCLIIGLESEAEKQKSEIGNLKSQDIEGWSEHYNTPEEIDAKLQKDKRAILEKYLWDVIGKDGNLLLYCGV